MATDPSDRPQEQSRRVIRHGATPRTQRQGLRLDKPKLLSQTGAYQEKVDACCHRRWSPFVNYVQSGSDDLQTEEATGQLTHVVANPSRASPKPAKRVRCLINRRPPLPSTFSYSVGGVGAVACLDRHLLCKWDRAWMPVKRSSGNAIISDPPTLGERRLVHALHQTPSDPELTEGPTDDAKGGRVLAIAGFQKRSMIGTNGYAGIASGSQSATRQFEAVCPV
jgi:hypothetical protein